MGKTLSWKAALVAVVALGTTALLGLNMVTASSGVANSSQISQGTVVRSSFVVGKGVATDGTVGEITTDYWLRVGPQGQEESLRATLKDSEGAVLQDGIRHRSDGISETYFYDSDEVVQTQRPQSVDAVMWSEDSIANELLRNGFALIGETQIAGLTANIFEQTTDIQNETSSELFLAAGIDPKLVTHAVRRVYIGADPFGVDLGEEAGYVLSDGSEFIPYYRRITTWQIVNSDVSAGLFEWSPSAAREAIR